MTTTISNVVYLNPSTEGELDKLYNILAPYSWADGEFGLMLTDVSFEECVNSLSNGTPKSIKSFLQSALTNVHQSDAGDICLNLGLYK